MNLCIQKKPKGFASLLCRLNESDSDNPLIHKNDYRCIFELLIHQYNREKKFNILAMYCKEYVDETEYINVYFYTKNFNIESFTSNRIRDFYEVIDLVVQYCRIHKKPFFPVLIDISQDYEFI